MQTKIAWSPALRQFMLMAAARNIDIPDVLKPSAAAVLERIATPENSAVLAALKTGVSDPLEYVVACSEYAANTLMRYPELIAELATSGRLQTPVEKQALLLAYGPADPDNASETQFMRRLRLFRHRELLRIIVRDSLGLATVRQTLAELSDLADICIHIALQRAHADLQSRYGVPRDTAGEEARFVVVAMGKLGGQELNFSSDVDLVFLYTASGETDARRAIPNEDYFRRLAQQLVNLLNKSTADGFVYRVDARLRPFGDSAPLACSVDAFEDYLVQHGRDWERYAWTKARIVNGWVSAQSFYDQILRPFIYRRYLDFGVFVSLREMKAMIEQEGRAAENRENIKLGPGGIREVEFIAQTLQLVRGGTLPALQERNLLTTLDVIRIQGLLPAATVHDLEQAYLFLRALENRLQAIADRQTHELPTDEESRARLVLAMGYADWPALCAELNAHRDSVRMHFEEILRHERAAGSSAAESGAEDVRVIAAQVFADPDIPLTRIEVLRNGSLYRRMDDISRQRLERLLPALLLACGRLRAGSQRAFEGVLRIVESIGRRSAYIALLNENSDALDRLVQLSASSDMLSRLIEAHPLLLDELLDQRLFLEPPTREDFVADIGHRLGVLPESDIEQRLESLRNFQQAAVFRVVVADLSHTLAVMRVSDLLTEIAEIVLDEALSLGLAELTSRHGKPTCVVNGVTREVGFGIVGYGKLGGLELGYGSDLDIVFVHDSEGESQQTEGAEPIDNPVFFARLARRVTQFLTMHTPSGPLYDVDTRLRPSGNSGLLVTSLKALDQYQHKDAWTWEHQALLRARAVAGDAAVQEAFEALRIHAINEYVRRDTLREEVAQMRERMRAELSSSADNTFDIKQGEGGIIDIEFLVQYLVLLNAHKLPALAQWPDNVRQLEALGRSDLLAAEDADALTNAYLGYRTRVHMLTLAGDPRVVSADEFIAERSRVKALWCEFLGQTSS